MGMNINQVYIANPITTNATTDLMYFGQSPYGPTNDVAMTYANFSAQFAFLGFTAKNVTTSTQAMLGNMSYFINYAGGLCTLTLPATAVIGDKISIRGTSSGGWTVIENSGQSIKFVGGTTATTTGSLSSTNQYDCLTIECIVANTTFIITATTSAGLTVV